LNWHKETLMISTRGKGLYSFTNEVDVRVRKWGVREGMCYLYLPHTSASLVISENYDPTARRDLEDFMDHLVPEGQDWYKHTLEGADDSPSHMRAMLTLTSISIPIEEGRLALGTWQGIYLFEHRVTGNYRKVLVRCLQIE
jgi:secondary thiamine-phosphate synthase enzyme